MAHLWKHGRVWYLRYLGGHRENVGGDEGRAREALSVAQRREEPPYVVGRAFRRKQRIAHVRAMCLSLLGGRCVACAATTGLEVDHVDPAKRSFWPTTDANRSDDAIRAELTKCQLLCRSCHVAKTIRERGFRPAAHGRLAMYNRGCRCERCRRANADAARAKYARRRAEAEARRCPA